MDERDHQIAMLMIHVRMLEEEIEMLWEQFQPPPKIFLHTYN